MYCGCTIDYRYWRIICIGALSVMIYNANFNRRFESYEPLMLYVDDFDGLERIQYDFLSDKGQKLTGYLYHAGENQRGIVKAYSSDYSGNGCL